MLDIREGDIVVLPDNKEATVKAVGEWQRVALSAGFARQLTQQCKTKRGTFAAGKRGAPVVYLNPLYATTPYPVNAEMQLSFALDAGYEVKQMIVGDSDGTLEITVALVK